MQPTQLDQDNVFIFAAASMTGGEKDVFETYEIPKACGFDFTILCINA